VINNASKEEKKIELDGVFIEIGRIAHTDLIKDLVERDERDQIIVDKSFGTKTPGIFAGGDVVAGDYKQITIAMGQATVAALSAYQYLQLKKGKPEQIVYDRSIRSRNL
jgi:alkyl hydroperoxide reductase subunit AhpF